MGPFGVNVVIGAVVAAAISLLAHGVLAATAKRREWTASLSGAATLLACAIGLLVMHPPVAFPPKNVADWPTWTMLAGALMLAVAPTRRWRRGVVALLLVGGCTVLVLHPLQEFSAHAVGYAAAFALIAGASVFAADLALAARGPFAQRAAMTVTAGAAFGALMLAGSFDIAGRGAVIPAAIAAPLVVWWLRVPADGIAAPTTIAFAVIAALAYGLTDWTTPPKSTALAPAFVLVAIAPAAAWLARIPVINSRPRLAGTLAVVATLLVAGAGVGWLALHQPVKQADEYGW